MTDKKNDKPKNHYVDNEEFLDEMIEFRISVIEAKKSSKPRPQIPNSIGKKFMDIATHLSYKPNFINYTFTDEMISDGVENCLQYIDNFDPDKSRNPFAYFTQIIYYAFLRRIEKEKKQLYIRYKAMEQSGLLDDLIAHDTQGEVKHQIIEPKFYDNMRDFTQAFEEAMHKKKEKASQKRKESKEE